jgi:hypothetical protein
MAMRKHVLILGSAAVAFAASVYLFAAQQVSGQPIPLSVDRYARPVRIAYITNQKYTGNLGGLAGADNKCNTDVARPLKNINYKAYLFSYNDLSRLRSATDKMIVYSFFGDYGSSYNEKRGWRAQLWTIGNDLILSDSFGQGAGTFWAAKYIPGPDYWETCGDWTISDYYDASLGIGLSSSGNPIEEQSVMTCGGIAPLLCIEWSE